MAALVSLLETRNGGVSFVGEALAPLFEPGGWIDEPLHGGSGGGGWLGSSEVAALGGGGEIGAVVGDDLVEEISGVAGVVGVGDDEELIALATAGGADVQPAAGRHTVEEFVGDVDRRALVAVLGRRVPEADVVADVVGGEADGAVPRVRCHGDRLVRVGSGDDPQVPVADRVTGRGGERAVVASGDDEVSGVGGLTTTDRNGPARREVAVGETGGLDRGVDLVDVGVRSGCDRNAAAVAVVVDPVVGEAFEVRVDTPWGDPVVFLGISPLGGRVVMTLDGTAVPRRLVGCVRGSSAAAWSCTR